MPLNKESKSNIYIYPWESYESNHSPSTNEKELSSLPRLRSPTLWALTKCMEKKLTSIPQECSELYWTSSEATPHKTAAVRPPTTYHKKLSKLDEPDMKDTAEEVRTNSLAMYSCRPLHKDEQR